MIDLAAADVVFLSYDEPEAEANFRHLATRIPRARRVHGVKGFDAAHRKAAEAAADWVFVVDGDNRIIDPEFFGQWLDIAPRDLGQVFSFSARNLLNGLSYGNGGVKLWPRELLEGLRSHETATRVEGQLDFWTVPFYLINRELSEIRMAATAAQAFRSGYREGVKLCLNCGRPPLVTHLQEPDRPGDVFDPANLERLQAWCTIGGDQPNGDWAILGARMGAVRTLVDAAPTAIIADYAAFAQFWATLAARLTDPQTRADEAETLAQKLELVLGLHLPRLDAEASRHARDAVKRHRVYGPLVPL